MIVLVEPASAVVADEGLGHALLTIGVVLLIAFVLPFVMAWLEPARPDQRTRLTAKRPLEGQQTRLRVDTGAVSKARTHPHA